MNRNFRSDGSYLRPVWLPRTKPFYLFKYKTKCQTVEGMVVTEETIFWDDEDNNHNGHESGSHPASSGGGNYVTVHYCYYVPVSQLQTGAIIGK